MGAADLAVAAVPRIKREECKRTKHDSVFSKWQVLIGPSDWEDYSLGKEGASRYRLHNLPTTTGPGVYELGVAVSRSGSGRDVNKLDSDGVAVVYLGQADSVRTRLQSYGRTGAHLHDCGIKQGSGYFDDIFGRGHSIVYRWVPMKNKADALKTEAELLNTFDYAWNKGSNGARRHDDVLQKLNKVASRSIQFPKTVRKLLYFSQKPVGIKIKGIKLPLQGNKFSANADESHNFFSQIFKFNKSQPRLVLNRHGDVKDYTGICGVSLGDDSVCRNPPVEGRKRCTQHKGLKIRGTTVPKLDTQGKSLLDNTDSKSSVTVKRESHGHGADEYAVSEGFSPEMYKPGTVKPQVFSKKSVVNPTVCGVELGNGYICTKQPVTGRVRCEEHKGLRVNAIISKSSAKDEPHVYDDSKCSPSATVCGALAHNGSFCSKPVKENTRCWQHSVSDMGSTTSRCNEYGETSICGAPTRNGSYCRRSVKGSGRCYQH